MAHNKNKLKNKVLKNVKKHKLFTITDVCRILKISTETFYKYFAKEQKGLSDGEMSDYDEIVSELDKNKVDVTNTIKHKWINSENFSSQIALYKLACTEIDRRKLSQQYNDVTSGGEKIEFIEK